MKRRRGLRRCFRVSIHADDYDDKPALRRGSVLPAAFALCGRTPQRQDLMLAFTSGSRSKTRSAAPSRLATTAKASTTGTCGSFGSAAASVRLRGLAPLTACARDRRVTGKRHRDNFSSMTKPFHAGHAAENARSPPIWPRWALPPPTTSSKPLGFFQAAGGASSGRHRRPPETRGCSCRPATSSSSSRAERFNGP